MILQSRENWKEPLPYNKGVVVPVVFGDFVILFSQSTSLTFKSMQRKIVNVLLKFSDPTPPSSEIWMITQ